MTAALADNKITLHSTATTEQTETNNTTYTYYELLKATIDGNAVAYYLDSPASDTLKGLLEAVTYTNASEATVTPFTFTKSADGTKWIATISSDVATTDGVALAAALNTAAIKAAAIASNYVTASGTSDVEITVPNDGYYLIIASNGKNLALQTIGDVTITEKNTYPTIDKTQGDEDVATQNHDDRDVAVGDVLTYNVTVHVPADAKTGDIIQVYDKATNGLSYNASSMTVTPSTASVADATAENGDTWRKNITITSDVIDQDVVFSFTMTVTDAALVDEGKENEAGLKYGNSDGWYYESKPVKVKYKTYYAGIHKVDGNDTTVDLAGVKFDLKEDGVAFNVTLGNDGYYVPGGSSNEVVTDSQGRIMIRGLVEDKTYTLTETYTLPGYNLLTTDVTLRLYEDTYTVVDENGEQTVTTSFDPTKTNAAWGEVKNNKGAELPSTGGIGTTLFYVGGGVLVLAAVILLVTKRRMNAND